MGKLYNVARSRLGRVANAPSSSGAAINRDPKANKVKRAGYQTVPNGGGRDNLESPGVDLARIAAAIERDAYLSQAHLKYSELVVKQGFHFKAKDQTALEYLNQRLKMMEIATGTTLNTLIEGIASDIVKFANCFLVKARAKGGVGLAPGVNVMAMPPAKDPVAGYFLVPAESITIARDKNGEILVYQQEIQGQDKPLTFRPEDVVHIAWNRPSGKAFGDSFFGPVLEDVLILRTIEQNVNLLTRRFTFPLVKYRVGVNGTKEASDEEVDEVTAQVDNAEIDSIYVMPGRHDMEGVNIPTIDMHNYLKYFEDRVFSDLGLSAVDFGRGNTANRNTADAMGGIKTDRVKSFERVIGIEFTRQVIEEILVEGGFDPFVNPDYSVELVFNEIEMEALIKRETHEIYKFEHNAQTFEEMRLAIGEDPAVDESRLNRFIAAELASQQATEKVSAEGGSSETDNKQKPANQNGARSGPKRSSEGLRYKENVQQVLQGASKIERLQRASDWFSELEDLALNIAHKHADETGLSFESSHLSKIKWVVDAPKDAYLKRIGENDTHIAYMMERHHQMVQERAKWYGYALAHSMNGCEKFKVKAAVACKKCSERDGEIINVAISKENAHMLLSFVPPFHVGGKHVELEAIY